MSKFSVKNDASFFISVAKTDRHSFLMLGVIDDDGTPKLLCRVGKTNDIDVDGGKDWPLIKKQLSSEAAARIKDEGITRSERHTTDISYHAYRITLKQYSEFLRLLAQIESKQKDKYSKSSLPHPTIARDSVDEGIKCFIPQASEAKHTDRQTFEYGKLSNSPFLTSNPNDKADKISFDAQSLSVSNTCRTTAIQLLEYTLGYETKLSHYFFKDLPFNTTLRAGQPPKGRFYILPPPPPPPMGDSTQKMSEKRRSILERIYNRLEEIPLIGPESSETFEKFEAVKKLYDTVYSLSDEVSVFDLLTAINEHQKNNSEALFKPRQQGTLSKALGLSTSTERLYKAIIDELRPLVSQNSITEPAPEIPKTKGNTIISGRPCSIEQSPKIDHDSPKINSPLEPKSPQKRAKADINLSSSIAIKKALSDDTKELNVVYAFKTNSKEQSFIRYPNDDATTPLLNLEPPEKFETTDNKFSLGLHVFSPSGQPYTLYQSSSGVPTAVLTQEDAQFVPPSHSRNHDLNNKLSLAVTIINMIDNVLAKSDEINITTEDPFIADIAREYLDYLQKKDLRIDIINISLNDQRECPEDVSTNSAKKIFDSLSDAIAKQLPENPAIEAMKNRQNMASHSIPSVPSYK